MTGCRENNSMNSLIFSSSASSISCHSSVGVVGRTKLSVASASHVSIGFGAIMRVQCNGLRFWGVSAFFRSAAKI